MQINLTTKLTIAIVFPVLMLLLPLGVGAWLPDIFFGNVNVLASKKLASGHSFKVIQYWNKVDFYNTELHYILPDGQLKVTTLDLDDSKTWWTPMYVNADKKQVTVTLGNNRVRTLNW